MMEVIIILKILSQEIKSLSTWEVLRYKNILFKIKYVLNSKLIFSRILQYETCRSTLTSFPTTLLGSIFSRYSDEENPLADPNHKNEFFIDRDGHLFHYIMQFYRTGKVPTIEQGEIFSKLSLPLLLLLHLFLIFFFFFIQRLD